MEVSSETSIDARSHEAGAVKDADAVKEAGASIAIPCARGATVVMPLGDSITQGGNAADQGGYRSRLFHLALQDHHTIKFVGSMSNGPSTVDGQAFPSAHEGHPGFTISGDKNGAYGILPLVPGAIKAFHPEIITLMIGTNDVLQQMDLAHASDRLAALLDEILATDPNVCLIVAKATPLADAVGNARVEAYDASIPDLIASRAATGKHIALVDMYAAFTANASYKTQLLQDGIHPTDAGYQLMAGTWYAPLGGLLK
jgi:lysophospholipase L1-like esterase